MSKETPVWWPEAKQLCRDAGIEIAGWGADAIVVYAKSPERAQQAASLLSPLGFQIIEDPDDAYAGLLTLSRNPAVTRAQQSR